MLKQFTKRRILYFLLGFVALVYLNNTSFLAKPIGTKPILIAHRGLGQPYDRTGLTGSSCTASKMLHPSPYDYLENTIHAMEAAFAYGADIIEFDVHLTVDNRFAVFHDWTLECRTDGTGVTREHTLEALQKLDVGYGYTADGGKTFPFRGKGVGMMPSLEKVLAKFPDGSFLIDVKSNDPKEGQILAERLKVLMKDRSGSIMIHGGPKPVAEVRRLLPGIQTISNKRLKRGLIRYLLIGWTGYVTSDCRQSVLMVPANYSRLMWGWPNRFLQRMDKVGSRVVVMGDYERGGFATGFNDPERVADLPSDYSGGMDGQSRSHWASASGCPLS